MLSKHIDFKGMNNLRDLGGMTNVLGKKIKSNMLFRSDHLHNAIEISFSYRSHTISV